MKQSHQFDVEEQGDKKEVNDDKEIKEHIIAYKIIAVYFDTVNDHHFSWRSCMNSRSASLLSDKKSKSIQLKEECPCKQCKLVYRICLDDPNAIAWQTSIRQKMVDALITLTVK